MNLWTFTISKIIATFGSSVYSFGISLYLLQLTGSSLNFSLNLFFGILPTIILSPFAGYLADRISRKKLVVSSQLLAIATVCLLFLLLQEGSVAAGYFYLSSSLLSISSMFISITINASIGNLVEAASIQKAVSYNQSASSLSAIGGPVIGGMLYSFFSIQVFLIILIVASIVALFLDASLNFTLFKKQDGMAGNSAKIESFWTSFVSGFKYAAGKRLIMKILTIAVWINFFAAALQVGMPYIIVQELEMSSQALGFIEAMLAAGMLVMALSFSRFKSSTARLIPLGLISLGVLLAFFVLPVLLPLPAVLQFIILAVSTFMVGASLIFINNPIGVLMQTEIEDAYKGRVFSIMQAGATAMAPFGIIVYGVLFDYVSPAVIMISSGAVIALISVVMGRNLFEPALEELPAEVTSEKDGYTASS
ncbi:MFS transporter [Terribacillus saccharophilus]|uniref:Major facilitator superfamily (MFS) profile domain-containing protein n=1 Tax=Terribacillus saccharophilus TaxID=361277 RepID=A0ABX4GYH9_9BACI|nr:MFS transporter [Terribacillus saccharophilus]PAD35780.1 hypothetical protein CHH56_07660 [Terribacillus saccharophilus]PAD96349.1 hypothetical protein CHH50_08895 [Terribacillus saccharophilus]PAD99924.1 hypothetical protein CHH48_09800 [Terribacillus saccharophilus]